MVTSPAEGASLISAAPTITGTAEPATLVILDGPFGVRTEADASGSWTMTISDRRPLTVGRQTLTLENFACELDQYAHGACPHTALAIRRLTVTVSTSARTPGPPVPRPAPHPVIDGSAEARYICNELQNPDGSIRQIAAGIPASPYLATTVEPYFANYAVMGLAREAKDNPAVAACGWAALLWYARHEVTGASVDGLVYEYATASDGTTYPLYTYDSVDAYAATFLMAVRDMYAATGYFPELGVGASSWYQRIRGPFGILDHLLEASGAGRPTGSFNLVELAPDDHVIRDATQAFSLDNIEALNGFRATVTLAAALGDEALVAEARADALHLEQGLEQTLWRPSAAAYDFVVDPATGRRVATDYGADFYRGGAMSNLFAIALDATVTAPEGAATRNRTILNAFFSAAARSPLVDPGCWPGKPQWEQDMLCYGAPLSIEAIASIDSADAVHAATDASCAFSQTVGLPLASGCGSDTPTLPSLAVAGAVGQLMVAVTALYRGVSWQR
jgi:hypothetical protein